LVTVAVQIGVPGVAEAESKSDIVPDFGTTVVGATPGGTAETTDASETIWFTSEVAGAAVVTAAVVAAGVTAGLIVDKVDVRKLVSGA
jgi:hypothetical protein